MTYYKVITASTPEALAADVEKHLNNGWWLQGGVSVGVKRVPHIFPSGMQGVQDEAVFAQAVMMTKHETLPIEQKQEATVEA